MAVADEICDSWNRLWSFCHLLLQGAILAFEGLRVLLAVRNNVLFN